MPKLKLKTEAKEAIALFVGWRLAILIISLIAADKLPDNPFVSTNQSLPLVWAIWVKYDINWYTDLAHFGYQSLRQTAFFPLWPFAIAVAQHIFAFASLAGVGFFLANLLVVGSAIILYKLTSLDYSRAVARQSLLFLLLFPASFYLLIGYSESLFLFLTLSVFYLARRQFWVAAGLVGFFVSLTRPLGALIFVPVLILYFEDKDFDFKKIRFDFLAIFLIPLGLLAYMYFLHLHFHDYLAFVKAQAYWNRTIAGTQFLNELKLTGQLLIQPSHVLTGPGMAQLLNTIFYLLPLPIAYFLWREGKRAYSLYILMLGFVPLIAGTLSFIRFLMVVFPLHIGLARLSEKYSWLSYLILPTLVGLLFLYVALFVNGFWVA